MLSSRETKDLLQRLNLSSRVLDRQLFEFSNATTQSFQGDYRKPQIIKLELKQDLLQHLNLFSRVLEL